MSIITVLSSIINLVIILWLFLVVWELFVFSTIAMKQEY